MKNKWDTPTLDSDGKQLKMYTQWGAMMLRRSLYSDKWLFVFKRRIMGDCKMKSVSNKIEKEKSKEIVFPVLAKHVGCDSVVLFIDYTKGVVVHGDPSTFSSRYYENYVSVDINSVWRILSPEESIVLSND